MQAGVKKKNISQDMLKKKKKNAQHIVVLYSCLDFLSSYPQNYIVSSVNGSVYIGDYLLRY